ncbi:hypothetical protein [Burkholderia sp. Ac-20365]|jgi:hypothetical protein|uniref:hypothetical protein n=1 Tax=Burkholderia sp. Ac-20365 TaxID=2703897 RepID=UPI00197BA176|nr:hypothetical protein [Burkholderia sp. Ac-20365]MBN3760671.1 hypothetical protein [Burkholderia sp. Ac-20365]
MATGKAGATVMTVMHPGAMRLVRRTLGWGITLCGMLILLNDVSAAIGPFLYGVADAIIKTTS